MFNGKKKKKSFVFCSILFTFTAPCGLEEGSYTACQILYVKFSHKFEITLDFNKL